MNAIQPEQLDPKAQALTKAIALQENGGNPPTEQSYLNKGASGERGLYQFTKPTWQQYAKEVLGNPNADPTPDNQNKVAYTKVKGWLDSGKTPEEVAGLWNGRPANPVGVNSMGVKYDSNAYREGVLNHYQSQLKQSNTKEVQQDPTSFLSKVIDFAFPIVGDIQNNIKGTSKKTGLQQLGDLGLSALWFLPGLGEVAQGARGAGLIGEGAAKVLAKPLISGAITGYGADVASNLSEGKTGAEAITPGFGTATGGVLGKVLGNVGSKYSQEGIVNTIAKENNSVFGQTKRGATDLAEAFSKDHNLGDLAAKKGINLKSIINPETVAYDTSSHVGQLLQKDVPALSEVLGSVLEKVPGSITVRDMEKKIEQSINKFAKDKTTAKELKDVAYAELDKIRQDYGEVLSASQLHNLKQREWDLSRFDINSTRTQPQRLVHRVIGNTFKTGVEDMASNSGIKGVKEFNDYIGAHLDLADALSKLNGTKAKGGRLGDLMRRHALGVVGAASGGMFGGGIIGSLVGGMAGEYAGGKLSSVLRTIEASPLKTAILKRIQQEDPEIVKKMIEHAKSTPQGLEAIREFLSSKGADIFEGPASSKSTKVLNPAPYKTGMLQELGTKAGIRLTQ